MKCVVVIGTYNEAQNIPSLLPDVMDLGDEYEAIVVDDNSPDGTGEIVSRLATEYPRVHLLHRERRLGYGTAYLDGFRAALSLGADYVVQMDADYSHNPNDVPRLVEAAHNVDVAIGSRYVSGGGTRGWPLRRRIISRVANLMARIVLGSPVNDFTGGFKCFPRATLESLDFGDVHSHGFGFLYEMNYICHRSGKSFSEVPILFVERQAGASKLSLGIVLDAVKVLIRLRVMGRGREG